MRSITHDQELSLRFGVATLSTPDVEAIHDALTVHFSESGDPISPAGIRDRSLLESAVSRQTVGSGTTLKHQDPRANAATLLYGLCLNHAFHNGNKRTAFVACLVHLDANGYMPHNVSHDEFYELVCTLARHELHAIPLLAKEVRRLRRRREWGGAHRSDAEIALLTKWLHAKTRLVDKRERPLTIRTLREVLTRLGCEFGEPHQNFLDVYGPARVVRTKLLYIIPRTEMKRTKVQMTYPGEGYVVPINTIKMVRRQLGLTPEDGIDSRVFYDRQAVVDTILNEYRGLLRRLARI